MFVAAAGPPEKPARGEAGPSLDDRARLLRILAHPARLAILEALMERGSSVKDLNRVVPLPQPSLSQHMAVLRKAELVAYHTDGQLRCYYVLRPSLVRELIRLLKREHPIRSRERPPARHGLRGGGG